MAAITRGVSRYFSVSKKSRAFFSNSKYWDPFFYLHGNRIKFKNEKPPPQCDWIQALRVPNLSAGLSKSGLWIGDGVHKLVYLDIIGKEDVNTEDELFHYYVQTFAKAIGSVEEAKRRIYLVSCGRQFGFGAEIDKEVERKLQEDENVTYIFDDPDYSKRKKNPTVQSRVRFTPINLNHRLNSIFSYHYLSEPNKKWNADHWLVSINHPDKGFINTAEVINSYIDILAKVLGSEEAAIKNIYSVWVKFPYGFGAQMDYKTVNELKGLSDVVKVIQDFSFDIKEKESDYSNALHIYPSSRGLRISCCRLDKEYGSEDWLISMEEYVGQIPYRGSSFLRCFPNLSDPYLTNNDRRSACKHWFIVMEKSCGETYSFQGRIDYCIQFLSTAVGWSVKRKIYRIKCVSDYIGFGINIAEMTSDKLRGIHGVRGVLPDYSIKRSNRVQSTLELITPHTQNQILGDMFTYHHLSSCYSTKFCNHWLIHIKEPNDGFSTESQIINFCIQMMAELVGSEEHAKKKIYSVWCKTPYGFGAEIDKKTFKLLKGLPNVLAVIPDYTPDVINRYRGALVISSSSFRPFNGGPSLYYGSLIKRPHE